MYLTNEKFVNRYLSDVTNIDEIIRYLNVIYVLLIRFGKKLNYNLFLKELKQIDEDLYNFIKILKKFGKLKKDTVLQLIKLLKERYTNYTKSFQGIVNDKVVDQVTFYIKEKFENIDVVFDNTSDLKVFVKGEGYYFKKSLKNDLDKLLRI